MAEHRRAVNLQIQVGERIRELRHRTKLSQEKFARKADIDRTYLCDVENGRCNVTIRTLAKIAKGLDVELAVFFSTEAFEG